MKTRMAGRGLERARAGSMTAARTSAARTGAARTNAARTGEARTEAAGTEAAGTAVRAPAASTAARSIAAAWVLVLAAAPLAGQGWIEPPPRTGDWGVVKLETDVTVRVDGRVAEVVVEEWFENRGGGLGEGDYIYPLPGEATFSSFSLYQGDEELRGETMDAAEARRIYEEIVRRQKDPALLELVGHGLVRARVFPIQPGERRRITLRYTQVLERAGDAVQFRYAAGGRTGGRIVQRPIPRLEERPDGAVPGWRAESVPVRFTLMADAERWGDPFSPTHALDVERRGDELRVRPESALSGDFSLFLPLPEDEVGISLVTHRPVGEDGYFMLTLTPGASGQGSTPRDLTAVVDVSGSMSGRKLEQTRAALHQLLGSLGPEDRFRLVSFSNRVAMNSEGWTTATGDGLREARAWVDALSAGGGTDIAGALQEALRLESPGDRLPVVVFLTDGLPTVGEQDPERIAEAAESRRERQRIFAFGVGYDVNTYLLDRLGSAGRGSTAYVEPAEDVERALSTLAAKINHPVLTDLRLAGAPVRLTEIHPGTLPDLFAGEELVLFGRYAGRGEGPLRIEGQRRGRTEGYETRASFPASAAANSYIPRLWAARKLGELTREIRINGASEELVEEVRRTALRYGLLSEYTSYLVLEPGAQLADARVGPAVPMAAAAAPQAATGEAAVKSSRRDRARMAVASSADLAEAEREAMDATAERLRGGGVAQRMVGGRVFRLQEDGPDGRLWTEVTAGEAPERTIDVAPFSDAYFAVVGALPELRGIVAELSPVAVHGERVTVRVVEGGRDSLSDRELTRLVRAFRGV